MFEPLTSQEEISSAILHVQVLLNTQVLVEDPVTGIIQLNGQLYTYLGKNAPATTSTNHQRAKVLAPLYQKLWPEKIMSGGRPVRQGPMSLTKKLTVFLNKNPKVTEQQILDATERYIATKKKENYAFMACSDYFIDKNGNSLLESYITNPNLGAKFKENTQAINQRFV
jgi:hypothetical protein